MAGSALTADSMLNAYSSASAEDPSIPSARNTPSPNPQAAARPYSRLSAIRRPPRLDIDAVRKAEARGSLTSLPDLIRRATRLAASLEKGRRPASRFDDLDDFPDLGVDVEKHQSGLSDMLAAFPPPAHPAANQGRRSIRDSIREQVQSWPLPLNFNRTPNTSQQAVPNSDSQRTDPKPRRRCCGLPLWGFIIILILVLVAIAAAVVIPVELLVVHKSNGNNSPLQEELQKCRQQLTCANGGTNVVNEGICSCICSNGFSGTGCTVTSTTGCTTISLTGADNISNVTIGDAVPRLLQQAQANFSVPLAANQILAKLNAGNLSCTAENALVTFDGRATRIGEVASSSSSSSSPDTANAAALAVDDDGVFFTTITVVVEPFTTFTLNPWPSTTTTTTTTTTTSTASLSRQLTTTTPRVTATSMVTTTMTMSSGAALPTASTPAFTVSEEALDFARVAVLFILQGDNLEDASAAQMALQKFFSAAQSSSSSSGGSGGGGGVSIDAARNVTVGQGKSVDLVDFVVDIGGGAGGRAGKGVPSSTTAAVARRDHRPPLGRRAVFGLLG
jgi:hypothetical protein